MKLLEPVEKQEISVENFGENQGIFLDVGGEKIGFREPCVKLTDFPTGFAQAAIA